jgi:outer membrane protein assembly factor BamB
MRPRPVSRRAWLAGVLAAAPALAGDWPQWRGPRRDGHAAPDEPLPERLPDNWEPVWVRPAGGGFASPVVAGGKIFFADEQDGQETLHCLQLADGRPLWSRPYAPSFGDEWGAGPRCTPVVAGDAVIAQSCRGELRVFEAATGAPRWGVSFERDYGVKFVGGADQSDAAARRRGHNGAPVSLPGGRLAVSVGGTAGAGLVCFDLARGAEVWRAQDDEAAYAPLVLRGPAAAPEVVAFTAFALLGLAADTGRLRWRVPLKTAANRHAVTPVVDGERVIVSSHTFGLRAFRITGQDGAHAVAEAWARPELKTSLATTVLVDGHLYGQGPDRDFLCVRAADGAVRWRQPGFGERPLVGYTATLAAGRRLLALTERGELVLLTADPERYAELSRQQVGGKTWSHPALAGRRLVLRDARRLACHAL